MQSKPFALSVLAMFVAVQDPGKKSQVPRQGRIGEENVENFPGGVCPVLPKCTNSRQCEQLLAKMCSNELIPCHGKPKLKIFLARTALGGKIRILDPRILATPRHSPTLPSKRFLGKPSAVA